MKPKLKQIFYNDMNFVLTGCAQINSNKTKHILLLSSSN